MELEDRVSLMSECIYLNCVLYTFELLVHPICLSLHGSR